MYLDLFCIIYIFLSLDWGSPPAPGFWRIVSGITFLLHWEEKRGEEKKLDLEKLDFLNSLASFVCIHKMSKHALDCAWVSGCVRGMCTLSLGLVGRRPGVGLWHAVSSIHSRRECIWIWVGSCVEQRESGDTRRPPGLPSLPQTLLAFAVELLKSCNKANVCFPILWTFILPSRLNYKVLCWVIITGPCYSLSLPLACLGLFEHTVNHPAECLIVHW